MTSAGTGVIVDPRGAFEADPHEAATSLLNARLISDVGQRVVVRITEVEAYGGVGADPGSHAHRGPTPRNAAMFGPVGHAYVYFSYGMHWCLNVVVHRPGAAGAVLIRAGEVVAGQPLARARRPAARTDRDLARGPARLAGALGVTASVDHADLLDPSSIVRLEPAGHGAPAPVNAASFHQGPRTGVSGPGAATAWRFWLPGEPSVSPYRAAASRGRSRQAPPPGPA